MEAISAEPEAGLIYTGLHLINDSAQFVGRVDPPPPDLALRNTLLIERPVVSLAQTGLIPKSVLEMIGGFDESLSTGADADLTCRIASKYPLVAVNRPLAMYRFHQGQMHLDPRATEKDAKAMFEKLFGGDVLPPDIRRERNRALANLYISLAGSYLLRGDKKGFLRNVGRAALRRPDRVIDALGRLTRPGTGFKRAA
jgi:hypothetical protein